MIRQTAILFPGSQAPWLAALAPARLCWLVAGLLRRAQLSEATNMLYFTQHSNLTNSTIQWILTLLDILERAGRYCWHWALMESFVTELHLKVEHFSSTFTIISRTGEELR